MAPSNFKKKLHSSLAIALHRTKDSF
jgi:hypothetical protein